MKNYTLILVLWCTLGASNAAFSQSKNREEQKPDIVYCQLIGYTNTLGKGETVVLDFGTKTTPGLDASQKEKLATTIYEYDSIVDALNYMCTNGWKLEEVFTTQQGDRSQQHYLLKLKR